MQLHDITVTADYLDHEYQNTHTVFLHKFFYVEFTKMTLWKKIPETKKNKAHMFVKYYVNT